MSNSNRNTLFLGLVAGVAVSVTTAMLMGQGASTPVKSETQYFVTGEGDDAHLWVREGANLRCVGHGECTTHKHAEGEGHNHHEGDDHDHGRAPGKP